MNYPSKRVEFQSSYLHPGVVPDFTADDFISLVEHGYDTAMWFGPPKDSQAALDACEPFLSLCEEYGIMAMLGSHTN